MPPFSFADYWSSSQTVRIFGQPIEIERDLRMHMYILRVHLQSIVYQMSVHQFEIEDSEPSEILSRFAQMIREERYANDHEGLGPAVTTVTTDPRTMPAREGAEHNGIHFDIDFERAIPTKTKALGGASLKLPKPKPKVRVIRFKKRLQSLAQKKE